MTFLLILLLCCSWAQSSIVINEIMYNHAASEMFEFVELYNRDATNAVSLSGWRFLIGTHHTYNPAPHPILHPDKLADHVDLFIPQTT